ncbi:DUF6380 family protein [Streptomyces sp. NRRL F-5650]|uniref:DUF6380 family protein n=1 Tax=Streptomyces sp. NRRL F-5650 TaxID=1463868 RepID=UPI000566BD09|nr:DUF6380 family protein [Streptomyces sp. NRRL F-5650]
MDTAGTLDTQDPCETIGGQQGATLRWRSASLTETVSRTPFKHHGGRTGKGAP